MCGMLKVMRRNEEEREKSSVMCVDCSGDKSGWWGGRQRTPVINE